MLLVVVSSGAKAEWLAVDENDVAVAYIDLATIIKNGNILNMWSMADLKTAKLDSIGPYKSIKSQVEIDCKEYKSQMHTAFFYSGHMSGGNEILSADLTSPEWKPIEPKTFFDALWKVACKNQWSF